MHTEEFISFGGETLVISTLRTIYHASSATLLLSDLHLGKTTHFRKNALPIPKEALLTDLKQLEIAINQYTPQRICFLGDLFHSTWNEEWILFSELMKNFSPVKKVLIAGNHDILKPEKYIEAEIEVLPRLHINNITLLHDATADIHPFSISGHVHPGYRIKGLARQSMVLPCFYVGRTKLFMPAFGSLTGKMALEKTHAEDEVWCFYKHRFYKC